jgi:ADP-ribose pyrophosphatase
VRRSLHRGRVGDFGIETVALPNGVTVELEILRHPGAAAIVPLHDDGTVTLVRQYRHAAGGFILELPAGKLEPGEDPEACALREMREEVGLAAAGAEKLGAIHTTPAFTDEVIHLYVGTGLEEGVHAREPDEVMTTERVPLLEAIAMIHDGRITDGKSIAGLLLLYTRSMTK